MASQVFSGTGSFFYTNSTGQNVRVVINYYTNYFTNSPGTTSPIRMSWGSGTSTVSIDSNPRMNFTTEILTFGRNLAGYQTGTAGGMQNMVSSTSNTALPTEIMLAPGQTFSVTARVANLSLGPYNIVVIPES